MPILGGGRIGSWGCLDCRVWAGKLFGLGLLTFTRTSTLESLGLWVSAYRWG
jgi:hypothetical protein